VDGSDVWVQMTRYVADRLDLEPGGRIFVREAVTSA